MNHNDPADRLTDLHAATADCLDGLLDIEAGLREALVAAQHSRTRDDLDIDIEAGLRAIVPTTEVPPPLTPTQPKHAEQRDIVNPYQIQGSVANRLMSLDTTHRLAIRQHPAIAALAVTLGVTEVMAAVHVLARDLNSGRALDRTLDLNRDLTRTLGLNHGLILDLNRARARLRDLARARTLGVGLGAARARARVLHRALDLDIAGDLARALAHDLAFNLDLARTLNRDLARAHDLARPRPFGRTRALTRARVLARDLDHARHDFTSADLSQADLSRVSRTGIRWSLVTKWPSEEWRSQALLDSEEISAGVYEIRSGTTNIPTHTA